MSPPYTIAVIGGGSGPIAIEDGLLNLTNNIISITGTHDNGGHSKEIRTTLGICAPGDITHRLAVHFRNERMRSLFMHRWNNLNNHAMNGHRPSNEILAAADIQEGGPSKAIKLLEKMFNPVFYKGKVIPVTDDPVHLKAIFTNGSVMEYEDNIDKRQTNIPAIKDVEFIPHSPAVNPEVLKYLMESEAIILACSSFFTSTLPILKVPKVAETIKKSPAKLIWVANAVTNYNETDGFKASDFARIIVEVIGRKIDCGLINTPNHTIPETYSEEKSQVVETDINHCRDYINQVYAQPFTKLYQINNKPTIRHDGTLVAQTIFQYLISDKRLKADLRLSKRFRGISLKERGTA